MELKDRLKYARKRANLTQSELAERAGIKQASVSEIERGLSRTSGYLVKIAQVCGVDPLWLAEGAGMPGHDPSSDVAPEKAGVSSADLVRAMLNKIGAGLSEETHSKILSAVGESVLRSDEVSSDIPSLEVRPEEIVIRQYDVHAAMGHGQVPPDYNEVIRNLIISEDALREKGVTYTSRHSLAMITGWDQSMESTINDKDPVIVDRGVNEFVGEGVYVITWHGLLYIKRMQMLDAERFRLISDNKHYENQEARIEDVTIHAKVLLIWNARKA